MSKRSKTDELNLGDAEDLDLSSELESFDIDTGAKKTKKKEPEPEVIETKNEFQAGMIYRKRVRANAQS